MSQAMADCILEGAFRRGRDRDRDRVLSSIPEGPHALTGVRVEPAAGPFGPGLPGFCL